MSTDPSAVATIPFFFSLTFMVTLKINTRAFFGGKLYIPQVTISYKLMRS